MICLDRLDNLGYTIEYGLDVILQEVPEVEYVYINFADSFLEDTLPSTSNDFVYYAEQNMDAS